MKLDIRKYGEPVLRQKTKTVKNPLDPEVQELVLCMLETMKANNGVGLAAPQVGSSLRLCTIDNEGSAMVLINPKMTAKSRNKIISEEGCLSFPGQFFPISRCANVQVRYLDEKGAHQKIKASGLLSRALQHEIDHLDGILFIDRIKKSSAKSKTKTDDKK
jgi:peptide deformylase